MKKKTLVFGASTNPQRYSYLALNELVSKGHDVVAFGIKKGSVAGIEIDNELENYEGIDTVTLYINPERQVAYYDYILSLKPKRVIFNPGTTNPEFYEILRENNIKFDVACTLVMLSIGNY